MKAANAALFGASWWPYGSYETLKIATYLSIWVWLTPSSRMYEAIWLTSNQLFVWDDGKQAHFRASWTSD